MMPTLALIGIPGPRWLPPAPVPVFLLWPLVPVCLAIAGLMRPGQPEKAETLRTAALMFCHLRGLVIDVESADDKPVKIRLV